MDTGLRHELYLNGVWRDVSSYVRQARETLITYGQSAYATHGVASCRFRMGDPDGDFAPRNPMGPWYGHLTGNTPHRVSVDGPGESHLLLSGGSGSLATTPDAASLSMTGDFDARVEATLHDWRAATGLIGQYDDSESDLGWILEIAVGGYLTLTYTTDGSTEVTLTSTAATCLQGRGAVRVVFDANDGAGGHDVTFYTSTAIDGSWTQLGDVVTGSGTVTLHNSSLALRVGDARDGDRLYGRVHAAELYDAVPALVADPDFTAQTEDDGSFDDDQGNTWTIAGDARLVERDYRWYGEARSWPRVIDPTGNDVTIDVISYDTTSRLLDSGRASESAYRRGVTSAVAPMEDLIAYWPMEDETDSASLTSGIDGPDMQIYGSPALSGNGDFPCSDDLPILATDAAFYANIPAHTCTGDYQLWFLLKIPADGLSATKRLVVLAFTTGTIWRFTINAYANGDLAVVVQDESWSTIASGGPWGFDVNGKLLRIALAVYQDGADTKYSLTTIEVGSTTGATSGEQTVSSETIGRATWIAYAPDKDLPSVVVGQTTIQTAITSAFAHADLLHAYDEESAMERLVRLIAEEGEIFTQHGDLESPADLGYQLPQGLGPLVTEAAKADGGILTADRDRLSTMYRSTPSMTAQDAVLTLSYTDSEPSAWQPLDDGQLVANDVTITRIGGSTKRATVTTGPRSTGVWGRAPVSLRLSLHDEEDAREQAYWRAHVGTVDAPRVPALPVELARAVFTEDATLTAAARTVRPGDRIDVTDLPDVEYPDDLQLVAIGATETITPFQHQIDFRCRPYEPYRAGVVNGSAHFIDTDGSDLSSPAGTHQATFAGSECMSQSGSDPADDNDVRVHVTLDDWTPGSQQCVAAKYVNAGNQRSWAFDCSTAGYLHLYLSTNGSSYTNVTSTATTGFANGSRHWIRWTRDAATGNVDFFTSSDGGTWTQLGTTVASGVTGTLHPSSGNYQMGARSGASVTSGISGTIYAVHVHDGIDGTELIDPDPSGWTDGYSGSGTGTTVAVQATSYLGVDITDGDVWTHDDGDYDIRIGGERMTVTAVTGATSPQVLTVTRAVNDIRKDHAAGAEVVLHQPVYIQYA